ncbi:MAG: zinc ribbon domain-containing protein [Candidatus Binataceae bacterium]
MADGRFCTKCGKPVAVEASYCPSCGAARIGAAQVSSAPPNEPAAKLAAIKLETKRNQRTAVERDAGIRLKTEHHKLIAKLGTLGGCLALVLFIILLVIADSMGHPAGEAFLGCLALAWAAAFVASFVPRFRPKFAKALAREKLIDPLTGRPLGMVWWYRWFTATLAVLSFCALGNYVEPPSHNTQPSVNASSTSNKPAAPSIPAEAAIPTSPAVLPSLRDVRQIYCRSAEDLMGEIFSHAVQGREIPDSPDVVSIDLIVKAEGKVKEQYTLSDTDAILTIA